ncbi:unnamed protein product [Toxocara canis]|uniref:PRKCSH-like domain-containing protein n=1 Tax=Toxocara canis TaxID=6265 RepID=A0A183U3G2_TOXCA|nr:unnamed protein product [Toxocara canis]
MELSALSSLANIEYRRKMGEQRSFVGELPCNQIPQPVLCGNKSLSQCRDAGFNSETLQCSSCNELPQFHLDQLVDDCNACCTPDESENQHEVSLFRMVINT